MKLSVMVCDDLEEDRVSLARMIRICCRKHDIELKLELSSSGEELLERFRPKLWDIIFLDIYMGKMSGAEVAKIIRAQDWDSALVFATNSREHGLLSYELQVSDYLVKPIVLRDLEDALEWILRERESQFKTLTVRSDWETEQIRLRDICYIEVVHHTATLHLTDRTRDIRRGLNELEAETGGSFIRCHRSFLVNLEYVADISRGEFCMNNGDRVPISNQRMAEVKKLYNDWLVEKNWGRQE